MRKIPVFYHIPKNAGTYINDFALGTLRYFRIHHTNWLKRICPEQTLKVLQVVHNGFIISRFFIGDPNLYVKNSNTLVKRSDIDFDIDLKNLSEDLLNNIFIFFVSIESSGFRIQNEILDKISNYEHIKFLILRDPFSRAQSFYKYIISESSIHEKTHGLIKSDTFEDYVLSEQLEDSWLIRNFLDIPDGTAIENKDFEKATHLLKNFHIYHINNVYIALMDIFKECYQINIGDIEDKFIKDLHKNENKYKKIKFEELSSNAQSVFRNTTFWDAKLYDELIKIDTLRL